MGWAVLGWIAAFSAAHAADLTPPQLLARIRNQMAQTLARLPDYTCRETIQRWVQPAGADHFKNRDLLHVDVAYVGSRELYAWPGSPRFGDQSLVEMIPDGAIATGNFGMLGRAVFADNGPIFFFDGSSVEKEPSQVRFSFRVPLERSSHAIRYGPRAAVAAYHGWFTADADSYDVIAFEVSANEIPRDLDTLQEVEHVEYARTHIGKSDYLLPATSDTLLMDLSGEISRNHVIFGDCREYSGESTVTFTEPGVIPPAEPPPAVPQPLPGGIELQLRLTTAIERGVTAIGDVVSAEVMKEIRRPMAIPKGAGVTLRVTRMEDLAIGRSLSHTVIFRLLRVEAGGQQHEVAKATLHRLRGPGRYSAGTNGADFLRRLLSANSRRSGNDMADAVRPSARPPRPG